MKRVGLLLLMLAGCSVVPERAVISPPPAESMGAYKVGKPYQIDGVWYYPREDFTYDETGIASWYGPGFHQKQTANGEVFNQDELTAAHPTLPMPSLARVTNLQNGKSIVVRINDRGPFAKGRIIDLSRRAAELLDMKNQGTARVRVQVLREESEAIAMAARGGRPPALQPATAARPAPIDRQVARQALPEPELASVAGETIEGHFLPAPVVQQAVVPANTNIFVQAGSFTRQENAQRLAQRLSHITEARVTEAQVNGQQFYRVRLGPLPDVAAADRVLGIVSSQGVAEPRIIVD